VTLGKYLLGFVLLSSFCIAASAQTQDTRPATDQHVEIVILGEVRQTLPVPDSREATPNAVKSTPEIADPVQLVVPSTGLDKAIAHSKVNPPPAPKAEPTKTPAPLSREASRQQAITRSAMSYRGMPYRWGGSQVETGIDCSGFTRYLYHKLGISLPHSARSQYEMGKPVQKADLIAGDLVFFNTDGPITHVGMYIGDGKFIHASNVRRGIKVDRLASRYYQTRYAGARRYTA
jgi:cell wall-associated NlpC family hydrolase